MRVIHFTHATAVLVVHGCITVTTQFIETPIVTRGNRSFGSIVASREPLVACSRTYRKRLS
jgi:hypothetical protein